MRRMTRDLICAITALYFGFVAVIVSAQQPGGNPQAQKLKNPVPTTKESIAAGSKVFRMYCRLCHGSNGKGDGPQAPEGTHPSDLTDDKWERGSTDGELYMVIRDGAGPKFDMKGYRGKLTDQEMWSVVNYLRSLGPPSKSH